MTTELAVLLPCTFNKYTTRKKISQYKKQPLQKYYYKIGNKAKIKL